MAKKCAKAKSRVFTKARLIDAGTHEEGVVRVDWWDGRTQEITVERDVQHELRRTFEEILAEARDSTHALVRDHANHVSSRLDTGGDLSLAQWSYYLGWLCHRAQTLHLGQTVLKGKKFTPDHRRGKCKLDDQQRQFVKTCYAKYRSAGYSKNRAGAQTKETLKTHHSVELSARQIIRICGE